jgi:hypothetical protein
VNYLKFELIEESSNVIMQYLTKTSDSFSVLYRIKRPYSDNPDYRAEHLAFKEEFDEFVLRKTIGATEWPGTKTRDIKNALWQYKLNSKSRVKLNRFSNMIYEFSNDMPEDITFYRGDNPWYITISHEKTAWLESPTEGDVAFFRGIGLIGG